MTKLKIGQVVVNPMGKKAVVDTVYPNEVIRVAYIRGGIGYGKKNYFKPTRL